MTSPSRLDVGIVRTEPEFAKLASEWNTLLQSTPADGIFLTWEWISTWWKVYGPGSQLHVLTARSDDGTLVGLFPLRRLRRRLLGVWTWDRVAFLGSGEDVTPEHLDVIVKPGWESRVIPEFFDALIRERSIKVVDLCPFATRSPHLPDLARRFSVRKGHLHRSVHSASPVMELPATREAFLAQRSPNYRKKVGEYERKCFRGLQATLRISDTAEAVARDLDTLEALHHKRWMWRSRAFRTSNYRRFHQELAPLLLDRGWMRLFMLEVQSQPMAALYCFSYQGRYSFYQSGRDPAFDKQRVGLVIMHRAILQAIEDHSSVFDFLRGQETYKYRWARRDEISDRLTYSTSLLVRVAGSAINVARHVARDLRGR